MKNYLFIEIVPQYPLPIKIYDEEDYYTWPARMMKEKGYKTKIVTLRKKGQKEKEIIKGLEVIRFNNNFKLFYYLFRNRKALFYAQGKITPLFTGFFAKHSVYITHATMGQNLPKYLSSAFLRCIYKVSLSRFSRVITISPYEFSLLHKLGFRSNLTYIPNAIDCSFFSKPFGETEFLKKYGLSKKSKKIIFLGNMHLGNKTNIETLFRAFNTVLEKFPNTKLIIIGQFPAQIFKSKEYVSIAKSTIFTGWLPHNEFCKAFTMADVFVNTSRYEGNPLSVAEAASAKIPLCLSNLPTVKSIYNSSALYHNPEDYQKLAKNIMTYFTSNRINRTNRENAYSIVHSTLDMIKVKLRMYEVIRSIIMEENKIQIGKEWDTHWKRSNVLYSMKQINYEDFYRTSFEKLFHKGDTVLEAGCGYGRYCFWLEKKGVKAVGIDIVAHAIDQGKKFAKENGFTSKIHVGDICTLPFKNNSFNGYISLGVIEHFESEVDVNKVFSEAYRVLKGGGKAFIVIPNPIAPHMILEKVLSLFGITKIYHKNVYTKDLIRYGEHAGFKVIETRVHDFYFPLYSIIRSVTRHDLWILKSIMKRILNTFDNIPILNNFGSGIAVVFEK